MPKRFSTKDLALVKAPAGDRPGIGVFRFTDDYSIFHYGKMPDAIPGKGEAICRMAVANFRLLESRGIATHFLRYLPPDRIEFRLLRVLDPARGEIGTGERNYLVPLQVVFRNLLPRGASVFRRLGREQLAAAVRELGMARPPEPGEKLPRPWIELTTKLEEIDRFVAEDEARRLAGLDEAGLERVKRLTRQVDEVITEKAESVGLVHADGKIEVGVDGGGDLILVDAAGTPDENRFLFDGLHLSKQVMRDHYAATGLERKVQEWAAAGRPRSSWPAPEPLPRGMVAAVSQLYRSLCERWTGETVWGAPPLEQVVASLRQAGWSSAA